MAYRAAVVGGSGYTGAELLRLLAGHPEIEVVLVTADSNVGASVSELYPSLAAAYPALVYAPVAAADLAGLDVVFLALPHGESQAIVGSLVDTVGHVVDLGADFRLPRRRLRAVVRRDAHRARAARPVRVRASRAVPRRDRSPPATWPRPVATRRPRRSRWRRCCTTGSWSRRASWSTRCRACRARAGG